MKFKKYFLNFLLPKSVQRHQAGNKNDKITQNSWVKEAYIERELPNTIKIKIKENKPIAIWQKEKDNKLITANCDVIDHGDVHIFKNDFPIIK